MIDFVTFHRPTPTTPSSSPPPTNDAAPARVVSFGIPYPYDEMLVLLRLKCTLFCRQRIQQ
jgi:hypothetical protein